MSTPCLHPREPRQSTDRAPYASYSILTRGEQQPFAVLRVGDQHGEEFLVFAEDVRTLKRIEEAVAAARFALENSRPLKLAGVSP